MKALGLVVLDKKISENCILKTYFLNLWPTFATNWNGWNKFGRGPPSDHSWEVWSKSNEQFQRSCLKKLLTDAQTMDDGQWAITKAYLEDIVLRWAKNTGTSQLQFVCEKFVTRQVVKFYKGTKVQVSDFRFTSKSKVSALSSVFLPN